MDCGRCFRFLSFFFAFCFLKSSILILRFQSLIFISAFVSDFVCFLSFWRFFIIAIEVDFGCFWRFWRGFLGFFWGDFLVFLKFLKCLCLGGIIFAPGYLLIFSSAVLINACNISRSLLSLVWTLNYDVLRIKSSLLESGLFVLKQLACFSMLSPNEENPE